MQKYNEIKYKPKNERKSNKSDDESQHKQCRKCNRKEWRKYWIRKHPLYNYLLDIPEPNEPDEYPGEYWLFWEKKQWWLQRESLSTDLYSNYNRNTFKMKMKQIMAETFGDYDPDFLAWSLERYSIYRKARILKMKQTL